MTRDPSRATAPPDLERLRIPRSPAASAHRSRRLPPWLLILPVVLVAAWVFRAELREMVAPAPGLPEVRTYRMGRLRGGTGPGVVSANGYVIARRQAALSTVLAGRLVELYVEEGSRVKKDQVVARIQFDDYANDHEARQRALAVIAAQRAEAERDVEAAQKAFAAIEAAVETSRRREKEAEVAEELTRRDVERQRPLHRAGQLSESELDRYETEHRLSLAALDTARARTLAETAAVEQACAVVTSRQATVERIEAQRLRAQADCESARLLLEKTYIRAPFDGIIVNKTAEKGEVVAATGATGNSRGSVATLVDFDTLEVQVELPETRLRDVLGDVVATVFLDADPDEGWPGRIRQRWPTADRQKATIELRITLDQKPEILRPEMGVRVVFRPVEPETAPDQQRTPLVLPESSILERQGERAWVFTLEDERVRRTEVVLGDPRGEGFTVEKGLEPGHLVVLSPPAGLRDGDPVIPK